MATHYGETIAPGIVAGQTPASIDMKQQVINTIIADAQNKGFTAQETAAILAIAKVESNYNPYAANKSSTASGVFQFIDGTGATYGLNSSNRFNIQLNVGAGIEYLDSAITNANALSNDSRFDQFTFAEKVYAFHHQGIYATNDAAYLYLTNQIIDQKTGLYTYPDSLKSKLVTADNAGNLTLSNQTNPDGSVTVKLPTSGEFSNLTGALLTGHTGTVTTGTGLYPTVPNMPQWTPAQMGSGLA